MVDNADKKEFLSSQLTLEQICRLFPMDRLTRFIVKMSKSIQPSSVYYFEDKKLETLCYFTNEPTRFEQKYGFPVVAAPASLKGMTPSETELVLINGVIVGDITRHKNIRLHDQGYKVDSFFDQSTPVKATYNGEPITLDFAKRGENFLEKFADLAKEPVYILGRVQKDGSISVYLAGSAFRTS